VKFFLVAILAFLLSHSLLAQRDTTFWFVAPDVSLIHEDRPVRFRISTGAEPTTVKVSQPANPSFSPVSISIPANSTRTHTFQNFQLSQIENSPPNQILNKGFLIESTALVTVYYEVGFSNNIDIFTLKGRNSLGQHFVIPGQNFWRNQVSDSYSSFELIATLDKTIIAIIPNINIVGHQAGDTIKLFLNKGQTYSARAISQEAQNTLAGSLVLSNKPIAITLSDDSIFGNTCYDLAGDQLVPIGILGKEYVVQRGELDANENERIFITSVYDNTSIKINGVEMGNPMMARDIRGFETSERNYIETSEPVYLMQYTGIGCEIGAALIPSINCKGSNQIAFTRSGNDSFFVNLIVKNGGQSQFKLNGSSNLISSNNFSSVPGTNNEWLSAKIPYSTAQIAPESPNIITNENFSFQLGFLDGGRRSGARFGYLSNFSSLFIGDDITLCEGEKRTISPKGDPDAEYTWSDGSTGSFLEVSEPGKYWVKTINNSGCELRDTLEVRINPSNFLDLNKTISVCRGDHATLDAGNHFGFLWNNGFTGRRLNTLVKGNYTVDVTNFNGCVDRGFFEVILVDPPALNLGQDIIECPDTGLVISSNMLDADSYNWSNQQTDASIALLDSGVYWLEIEKGVCTVRDSISIAYYPKPEINEIIGSSSVCPGIENIVYELKEKNNTSYDWFVDGGSISGLSNENSIQVNWGETKADAVVKLVETNEFLCKSDTNLFEVRVNIFLETETPKGDSVLCSNDVVQIPYKVHETSGSIYSWNINGGTIETGQGTGEILVNWSGIGKHSIQVNESSTTQDYICFGESDTEEVVVYKDSANLKIDVVTIDENNDHNTLIKWVLNNPNKVLQQMVLYRKSQEQPWEVLRTLDPKNGNLKDSNLETETTIYEYKIESLNGCDEVVISSTHNTIVLNGDSKEETGEINLTWNAYNGWPDAVARYEILRRLEGSGEFETIENVGNKVNSINMSNAVDGFKHEIRIRAVSPNGQVYSYSNVLLFEFEHIIVVPNVFTPNRDGINDTFIIPKIELYEQNQLTVFNRSGKQVFQKVNYQSDWDGGALPTGMYYYSLKIPLRNNVLTGTVSILK
jgi:gliding motility-associated-like protein